MDLYGQVALITGGAGGIGLMTTKELLKNGVNVAICDKSLAVGKAAVEQFQEIFGSHRIIFLQSDVCNDDEMNDAFTLTKEHFGKLDIFINCAGIFDDFNWNHEVDVNLKGTIRGTLLAWKHMGEEEGNPGGVVVNLASHLALRPFTGAPVYSATMHAVVAFSRSCGTAFHRQRTGVRVVTLCPGLTHTPLIEPSRDQRHLSPVIGRECYRVMGTLPSQKPQHVAEAMLHIIRNARSGSVWVSEGGQPVYEIDFPERQDQQSNK